MNHFNDDSKKQAFFPSQDSSSNNTVPSFEIMQQASDLIETVQEDCHYQEGGGGEGGGELLETAIEIVENRQTSSQSLPPILPCVRNLNSDLGIQDQPTGATKSSSEEGLDAPNKTIHAADDSTTTLVKAHIDVNQEPECLDLKTPIKFDCEKELLPPLRDIGL